MNSEWENEMETVTEYTITKSEWKNLHRDYRMGDPRKGTARMLKWVDGAGTCLVPVTVVADEVQA